MTEEERSGSGEQMVSVSGGSDDLDLGTPPEGDYSPPDSESIYGGSTSTAASILSILQNGSGGGSGSGNNGIFIQTGNGGGNPTTIINETLGNSTVLDCSHLDHDYDTIISLLSLLLFCLGALFCFYGYRCFKGILFLIGFGFGLVIVFLICQEEDLLPQYGNIGVAALAGSLYGLICVLVPYVGFFTLGFHFGLLIGLASILFFPPGYSIWVSIIYLLGAGLFGAIANVCFPSFTLWTTSLIGSGGMAMAVDYFVEKLKTANWLWRHVKEKQKIEFCWFSWFILCLWPTLLIIGGLIQYFITAKGFTIQACPYKKGERQVPKRRLTREERAIARQAKYRYLYQVRTAGGDILSQSYIQSLQNKSPHLDTLSTHMSTLHKHEEEAQDHHEEEESN